MVMQAISAITTAWVSINFPLRLRGFALKAVAFPSRASRLGVESFAVEKSG